MPIWHRPERGLHFQCWIVLTLTGEVNHAQKLVVDCLKLIVTLFSSRKVNGALS